MKSFKKFIEKPKQNYIPCNVHGAHANPETAKKNYIPVNVHGKHADPKNKKNITEEAKTYSDFKKYADDTKEFENHAALDKDLGGHYDEHMKRHPDLPHVKRFTSDSSDLNDSLIAHHGTSKEMPPYHKKTAEGLDRILSSKPAHKTFHTYSGLGFDPRQHADENHKLPSPAFLSSSPHATTAEDFAKVIDEHGRKRFKTKEGTKHIMKIEIPEGSTHGAYVNGVSTFGRIRPDSPHGVGEKEFTMKHNITYKLHPEKEVHIKDRDGHITHIIHHATVDEGK